MCMSNSCGPTGLDRRPRSLLDISAGILSATRTVAPSTSTRSRNRSGSHGPTHRRHRRLGVTPPSLTRSNASHTSVSSNGRRTTRRSPHQARRAACPDRNFAMPHRPCSSCTMRSSPQRQASISNPRHSSNGRPVVFSRRRPHERSNQRLGAHAEPRDRTRPCLEGPLRWQLVNEFHAQLCPLILGALARAFGCEEDHDTGGLELGEQDREHPNRRKREGTARLSQRRTARLCVECRTQSLGSPDDELRSH
jgi:hypothetical protein